MKKQFQLLLLIPISSFTIFTNAAETINYLNFIPAKDVTNFEININNSCNGAGTQIPDQNINTGFYNAQTKYYLKVQANQTNSKECFEQLNLTLQYTDKDYGIINYFPNFPDENSYSNALSKNDILASPDGIFAKLTYYTPADLFFFLNGHITIHWIDGNQYPHTSSIPITFALGKTAQRKNNSWFIVGNNSAEYPVEAGDATCFNSSWIYYKNWYTGIQLYDPITSQGFCLSSNLKDGNTIKVNVGYCQSSYSENGGPWCKW